MPIQRRLQEIKLVLLGWQVRARQYLLPRKQNHRRLLRIKLRVLVEMLPLTIMQPFQALRPTVPREHGLLERMLLFWLLQLE